MFRERYVQSLACLGLEAYLGPSILGGVSGVGYLGRGRGVRWGWTEQGEFDIYFCVFFDCCCRGLISGGGTGRWGMSPPKFKIFLLFHYFLRF